MGIIVSRIDENPEEWIPYAPQISTAMLKTFVSPLPILKAYARHGVDFTGEVNGIYLLDRTHFPDVVEWLLQSGANPDVGTDHPSPLMHYTNRLISYRSNMYSTPMPMKMMQIMKMLLAAGADPAYQDSNGNTALHLVLSTMDTDPHAPSELAEAVCLLMAAGTPVDVENHAGQTVADLFQTAVQKRPELEEQCSEAHLEEIRGQLARMKASFARRKTSLATVRVAAAHQRNRNNEKQEGGRRHKTRRHKKAKKAKKTYRRRQ